MGRSEASPANITTINERGHALWKSIYEPHAVKLYDKLASYHPDFICACVLFLVADHPLFAQLDLPLFSLWNVEPRLLKLYFNGYVGGCFFPPLPLYKTHSGCPL